VGDEAIIKSRTTRVDVGFINKAKQISEQCGKTISIPAFSRGMNTLIEQDHERVLNFFKLKGKRGSVTDFVYVFLLLFMVLVILLVMMQIGVGVIDNPGFVASVNTSTASSTALYQWSLMRDGGLDNWFVIGYFIIHILTILLAGTLPVASTAFVVINLIFVIIIGVLGGMFQTIFTELINRMGTANFSMTLWIINHFLILELGFMLIMLFVIYMVKKRGSY